MRISLSVLLACAVTASCNPSLPTGPDLDMDFNMSDASTTPLNPAGKLMMNGVYEVVQGKGELGNPVVGKWVGNRWCLYSETDVIFCVCAGGSVKNDSIKLWGYQRIVRSGSGTNLRLTISRDEGARALITADAPAPVRIRGVTDGGVPIELSRIRAINSAPFQRLAHRGGSRNSERLGISENSIPMIRYAPLMGATGVEVDVKRTRDNKLIVFHDDSFSPRTVQGAYLLGKVGEYDLEQITALGKLINGEQIPTLSELLTAVIDETDLSLVWLDIKDAGAVSQTVDVQRQMLEYAAGKGRNNLQILVGIPSQEVLDAWMPFSASSDALCELDVETVLSQPRIKFWAPTWTLDISQTDVRDVRAQGKKVFTWTVDIREGMLDYLDKVDGILTNYPSLITGLRGSQ